MDEIGEKKLELDNILLKNIKTRLPELESLLILIDKSLYEDMLYRFYHYSFKIYRVQDVTRDIIALLKSMSPNNQELNLWFLKIMDEGATKKEWESEHNMHWLKHTRPMLEAFLHAKYFLEMAVKYGHEMTEAPAHFLPSGWAALLELYNQR